MVSEIRDLKGYSDSSFSFTSYKNILASTRGDIVDVFTGKKVSIPTRSYCTYTGFIDGYMMVFNNPNYGSQYSEIYENYSVDKELSFI